MLSAFQSCVCKTSSKKPTLHGCSVNSNLLFSYQIMPIIPENQWYYTSITLGSYTIFLGQSPLMGYPFPLSFFCLY